MPSISVVIPCFNHGQFLREAIDSVAAQTLGGVEAVVVDDGSTDEQTLRVLDGLSGSTRIVRIPHQGLATARNAGISATNGTYILPLDADDRIAPSYLEKAVGVLEARPEVAIVYCQAELIGDVHGPWDLPAYSFPDVLIRPSIFASSVFRRSDWEKAGGFAAEMNLCWEDYDFWLTLVERGGEVYRIPEVLFYYRQHASSMIGARTREDYVAMFRKLFDRHRELYTQNIDVLFREIVSRWEVPPKRRPRTAVRKALDWGARWGGKAYRSLARVVE